MPPAVAVATAEILVDAGADFATSTIPSNAKAGDTLVAIIALDSADAGLDPDDADGWELLEDHAGPNSNLWIFRRAFEAGDSGAVSIELLGTLGNPGAGALLVYRGLDPSAAAVGASSSSIAAATNFVCPSRILTRYSDLYIGVVVVDTAATAVAPPAGTIERREVQHTGITLEVFDYLAEATGSTGTKTATTAGAQSGIASSVALAAAGLIGAGKSFTFDPVGAPGLPTEGI